MSREKPIRAAIDVGGTFTDLQFHHAGRAEVFAFKTPTTPDDPSKALVTGLTGAASRYGFDIADIGLIMHGSTIATNAVLERKLPKGALLTTAGFEDVLEIGRHMRKNVYALKAEDRSVLVPRHLRFGIRERVRSNGTVETDLDEAQVRAIVDDLLGQGVEAVAISFLHAYQYWEHEDRAAQIIADMAASLSIATSSVSSPEIREYERTSTTVLNALLKPVISGYLERVQARLSDAGITAPLYMVQSNGGVARPEEAARMPVNLLLSGPAGGAMAVGGLADRYDFASAVGLDMGGTSSDVCVVHNGQIGETAESEIDGLPVRLPMVEIRTIGAGGGSLARTEGNALRVGPQSAGAVPGPACYGRGGAQPTVTDANAVLGRIAPEAFMGGDMAFDVGQARAAIDGHVAQRLSLTDEAAAAGIVAVANTHMAGAIRLSLFEKGANPADFTLVPFGGAAGLHACAVAEELDMTTIVFPADASTLSARGLLEADLRHDLSISELMIADAAHLDRVAAALENLQAKARTLLSADDLPESRHRISFAGDLRYRGQAYEITTPWPDLENADGLDAAALQRLVAAFHDLHQTRFAHSAPNDPVELVTLRVVATGVLNKHTVVDGTTSDVAAKGNRGIRRVYLENGWAEVPVYSRAMLTGTNNKDGTLISGPAIIEEDYTVLLIGEGWQVSAAEAGDLRAVRTASANKSPN